MENEPNRTQRSRENMLATSLVLLIAGVFLFYLYIISLGIVGNVLSVGIAFVMLGAMHYLLWGRAFSAEVASEREALRRRNGLEPETPPPFPQNAIQDITRTQAIHKKLDQPHHHE